MWEGGDMGLRYFGSGGTVRTRLLGLTDHTVCGIFRLMESFLRLATRSVLTRRQKTLRKELRAERSQWPSLSQPALVHTSTIYTKMRRVLNEIPRMKRFS